MISENRDTKLKALSTPLPLARMAYEALRDSIVRGELRPGVIYNEMALAKELEISRTPVREALLELAAHGLVTFLPRKGVRVNNFSRHDVHEIFQIRKAIELFCVERAAQESVRLDLSPLTRMLRLQTESLDRGDMRAFITSDRNFHTAFAELLNNERMLDILTNIRDQIQIMSLDALLRPRRDREVMDEHRAILEAVQKGDAEAARRAINEHLDKSREAVLAGRSKTEQP